MAPVVLELRRYSDLADTLLVSTGQHREMLAQALGTFGLEPNFDLEIMSHGQTLAQITTRALEGIDRLLEEIQPDWVLAQGDTTTTFAASLAAFYQRIPFGHIEAGLRTDSIDSPFPEEFNRRASGLLSTMHFAPTPSAAQNLLQERCPAPSVFVTGNTGIDALTYVTEHSNTEWFPEWSGRVILLTTHRRENWGDPQRQIGRACRQLVEEHDDVLLVCPLHKNPVVREALTETLSGHERIKLIEPPEYEAFAKLMQRSTIVLTDSGGVQEEAPTFGLPVLVLRPSTERPEGVSAGIAALVGTDPDSILSAARPLLNSPEAYAKMAAVRSPYGDGRASARIRYSLLCRMGLKSPEEAMWS